MTTFADGPLPTLDTKVTRAKNRVREVARTLDDRFGMKHPLAPSTLGELVQEVQRALDDGVRLRMLGAARGLSWASDPVGTRVISSENLKAIVIGNAGDLPTLRRLPGIDMRSQVRVQAGLPFRTALSALNGETPPRTFATHGSGDFQSVVGALSTGTHGTGQFPSFAGLVRALVVVRVETIGQTRRPRVELIQGERPIYTVPSTGTWTSLEGLTVHAVTDPDIFAAHLVGLGALGLVYCVTLDVLPRVPLMEESRVPRRLDEVLRDALADLDDPDVRGEFIVDPYPRAISDEVPAHRWRALVPFPAQRDFSVFRAQHIRRVPSSLGGPRFQLPASMTFGREPLAADLIGDRIKNLLEDPVRQAPDGADAMISCSSSARYVDWLPNVLLLNLKYSGVGAEWAVPVQQLEAALWEVLQDGWETFAAYERFSDNKGRWTGTEAQRLTLLESFAPIYNGPAVRFVTGEPALLAATHRSAWNNRRVPVWATIELGLLGRPGMDDEWRERKRHAGLRPEEPVPAELVDELLGRLRAQDAKSPGPGTWLEPRDLPPIRSDKKCAQLRIYAAYERGRVVTLNRISRRLCTPAIGGRPHQGLHHDLTWEEVEQHWGTAATRWRERFETVNPGVFDNMLTDRWLLRHRRPGGGIV